MKNLNEKILRSFTIFVFLFFLVIFFGSQRVEALNIGGDCVGIPSVGGSTTGIEQACFCSAAYRTAATLASGDKVCCKNDFTFDDRTFTDLTGVWCVNGGQEERPIRATNEGLDALVCEEGRYLVEFTGGGNYCLTPGAQQAAGDGYNSNIWAGYYFIGCKPSTPQRTTDRIPDNGDIINWPKFCQRDEGIFATSFDVCLCKGDTAAASKDILQQSNLTCDQFCGVKGIAYNKADNSGGPGGGAAVLCSGGVDCCFGNTVCESCVEGENVYTALGCISFNTNGLIVWLMRFAIGIIISISIFRFIQAATLLQKADPESVEEGKEIITSAVIALVVALLAVPLLSFIGVNILGIFPNLDFFK